MISLTAIDTLLMKYEFLSLVDTIQASTVTAVMFNLIDLAWELILGGLGKGGI
jgi:hypothetical protein